MFSRNHRPTSPIAIALACFFALAGCGLPDSGGVVSPPPPAGCPAYGADLQRFHPPGTASRDTWSFSPASCPTKDRATVKVPAGEKWGQGVWFASYPVGKVVTVGLHVKAKAGAGRVELRAGSDIYGEGYKALSSDAVEVHAPADPAEDRELPLVLSAAAPKAGYLLVGIYLDNVGVQVPLEVDLSSLSISPPPPR